MTTPPPPSIHTGHEVKQLVNPKNTLDAPGLRSLQGVTEDSVRAAYSRQLAPLGARLHTEFIQPFVERIADTLSGIVRHLGFEKLFGVGETFRDRQLELNNAVELLSPLLDYGSVYMDSVSGFKNYGIMPFNKQIGPMRGCELHDNGIRLDKPGQWDIIATVTASWVRLLSSEVTWRVCVKDPQGAMYSQRRFTVSNANNITMTLPFCVVVPEPGYVVQVEITYIAGGREVIGGAMWNGLTVKHITNSTTQTVLDQGGGSLHPNPDNDITGGTTSEEGRSRS